MHKCQKCQNIIKYFLKQSENTTKSAALDKTCLNFSEYHQAFVRSLIYKGHGVWNY